MMILPMFTYVQITKLLKNGDFIQKIKQSGSIKILKDNSNQIILN